MGSRIAVSEGAEAQMPFYPNKKPIDAYVAAALDAVSLDGPINDPISCWRLTTISGTGTVRATAIQAGIVGW